MTATNQRNTMGVGLGLGVLGTILIGGGLAADISADNSFGALVRQNPQVILQDDWDQNGWIRESLLYTIGGVLWVAGAAMVPASTARFPAEVRLKHDWNLGEPLPLDGKRDCRPAALREVPTPAPRSASGN